MIDYDQKARLAHIGDISVEASSIRLAAARAMTGLRQQDVADAVNIRKTAYSNMETGRSFPTRPVMRFFYREHRIDFNFLMNGDYAQLPADVQTQLWPALEAANSEWDRKQRSDRSRAFEPSTPLASS